MYKSKEIEHLTKLLGQFPGLGPRSAKRMILHMLTHKETLMAPLSTAISKAADVISECDLCGNLDAQNPCSICTDDKRNVTQLCVIQNVADLWALERTRSYTGHYHVLGGLLSALDGIKPSDLTIDTLCGRANEENVEEVIIALPATVDGQSTGHYIQNRMKECDVIITKLAHGVPVGGELDYLDDGTLSLALNSRKNA